MVSVKMSKGRYWIVVLLVSILKASSCHCLLRLQWLQLEGCTPRSSNVSTPFTASSVLRPIFPAPTFMRGAVPDGLLSRHRLDLEASSCHCLRGWTSVGNLSIMQINHSRPFCQVILKLCAATPSLDGASPRSVVRPIDGIVLGLGPVARVASNQQIVLPVASSAPARHDVLYGGLLAPDGRGAVATIHRASRTILSVLETC
jgi:hypothetical protein